MRARIFGLEQWAGDVSHRGVEKPKYGQSPATMGAALPSLCSRTRLGWMGLVVGPSLSKRHGSDRIRDPGRSTRKRLPGSGKALVVEGRRQRGNRLPPGVLRAGKDETQGSRRSLGASCAGIRVLGKSDSGAHASHA